MAQLRSASRPLGPQGANQGDMQPKLLFRSDQKLITGYPSDSPVSTTDEEWEAEERNSLRSQHKYDSQDSSSVPEEWTAQPGFVQHPTLPPGPVSRSTKRHWAPGEGVIDKHLFLLDDRPWQEFYTLFFTPLYFIAAICLLVMLLLLLIDGTVRFDQLLIFLAPCAVLVIGLLANLLLVCLFPVPSGSSAPAYDNWTDPLNLQ